MAEYLLLMHDDVEVGDEGAWQSYIGALRQTGAFEGGSEIGDGMCVRKNGQAPPITAHLVGYIRVNALSMEHAKSLLAGNPLFEAGGTVEIRELPKS
jgi:hypothetical protein